MILEKCVQLEPRLESEQAPHLTLGQRTGAITLDRQRFECLPGKIRPLALESF